MNIRFYFIGALIVTTLSCNRNAQIKESDDISDTLVQDPLMNGPENVSGGAQVFVFAPNGLNIRKEPSEKGEIIYSAPYATVLDLLDLRPNTKTMKADHIEAPIFEVGLTLGDKYIRGFSFGGYLLPYPTPKENEQVEAYYQRLYENMELRGFPMSYRKKQDGDESKGDVIIMYDILTVQLQSWEEAFVLAQVLCGIPKGIHFPGSKENEVINPEKPDFLWEDALSVKRNAKNLIESLEYYSRGEGGGKGVNIHRLGANSFEIAYRQIAD